MDAISVSSLNASYAGRSVLRSISFQVNRGEFFSLVGVNGAGKSTFIKSLLDFIDVDSGEVMVFGVSHLDIKARANLAFLPERFSPPYYLTGAEFIKYMLSLYAVSTDRARIESMARALDLRVTALDESVHHYSKGMTQKLGLAACFLSEKSLIVLDEPMSGLDPKARVLVKRQLQVLRQRGTTVFFSSHLLADVAELADRMAILNDGVLAFVGTPADCQSQYGSNNLETAFIRCIGAEALTS